MGNLKKHVLAPRANTQAEMNLGFQGTFYNLGERYTDLTKVLFVVFFYSALYPLAFFFGAAILFVQYYVRSSPNWIVPQERFDNQLTNSTVNARIFLLYRRTSTV
jgi:hypothetical protein